MKSTIKLLIAAGAVCYMAYGAYAENVQISTFYPSPFGDYQNLTVRGTLTSSTLINAVTLNATTVNATTVNGTTVNGTSADFTGTVDAGNFSKNGDVLQLSCGGGTCYAAYAP